MLSGINQAQKNKGHMTSLIFGSELRSRESGRVPGACVSTEERGKIALTWVLSPDRTRKSGRGLCCSVPWRACGFGSQKAKLGKGCGCFTLKQPCGSEETGMFDAS